MLRILLQSLKISVIVVTALMVALGGRWFYDFYMDREADPNIGRPVQITISEEDDADSVAEMLVDKGLIRSELYFKGRLQISGDILKPGTYNLRIGMSTSMILERITTAGVAKEDEDDNAEESAKVAEIQTIEGWRIGQIGEELERVADEANMRGFTAEAFEAAANEIENEQFEGLLDSRPEDQGLEGYLFPAKYPFSGDAVPKDLVYLMLETLDQTFSEEMRARAVDMGLTIHQVLTLASIVEREAQLPEERPVIARVYLNRLEADMPLGADPTVSYILGNEKEWWPELEGGEQGLPETDNQYNTYVYTGLPPGPICNPGVDSINGVLYPDENNFLFFVADGSGGHIFAETFEEHQQNINNLDAQGG